MKQSSVSEKGSLVVRDKKAGNSDQEAFDQGGVRV